MIPDTEHDITRIRILIMMFLDFINTVNLTIKCVFILLSHFDIKVVDNRERKTNPEYTKCIYLIKIKKTPLPLSPPTHTQKTKEKKKKRIYCLKRESCIKIIFKALVKLK